MELKLSYFKEPTERTDSLNRTFYGIETSVVMLFNTGRKLS